MNETITRRWSTPPQDARRLDRLDDEAGRQLREMVDGSQALLSNVLGLSETWVSKQVRGAPGSVQARLNKALVAAAERCRSIPDRVRAATPLAGGMVALVGTFVGFRGVELRRFLVAACKLETRDQADEDVREIDLVQLLERLPDEPTPTEAREALEIVRAYTQASVREIGAQLTVLAGVRALEERLEDASHVH